jgi:hypothetical protein
MTNVWWEIARILYYGVGIGGIVIAATISLLLSRWYISCATYLIVLLVAFGFGQTLRLLSVIVNGGSVMSTAENGFHTPFPNIVCVLVAASLLYWINIVMLGQFARSPPFSKRRKYFGVIAIFMFLLIFRTIGVAAIEVRVARQADVLFACWAGFFAVFSVLHMCTHLLRRIGGFDFAPRAHIQQFKDDSKYFHNIYAENYS